MGKRGKRKIKTFTIPHNPHDDVVLPEEVLPEEVQGIRAFGPEGELKTLEDVITFHSRLMRNRHAITLNGIEWGDGPWAAIWKESYRGGMDRLLGRRMQN